MASRWLDRVGLTNAAEFLHVIAGIVTCAPSWWGHVHQNYDALRQGVRLLATAFDRAQFVPNADDFTCGPRHRPIVPWSLRADGSLLTDGVWVDSTAVFLALGLLGSPDRSRRQPRVGDPRTHNTVYLAGRCTLLPARTRRCPPAFDRAYADSVQARNGARSGGQLRSAGGGGWMMEHGAAGGYHPA